MFVLDKSLTKPAVPLGERLRRGAGCLAHAPAHRMDASGPARDCTRPTSSTGRRHDRRCRASGSCSRTSERPMSEQARDRRTSARPMSSELTLQLPTAARSRSPSTSRTSAAIDLACGPASRNYTNTPEQYDEVGELFPDGRHTLVESDRHGVNKQVEDRHLPPGRSMASNRAERMTFFDASRRLPRLQPGREPGRPPRAVQLGIHGWRRARAAAWCSSTSSPGRRRWGGDPSSPAQLGMMPPMMPRPAPPRRPPGPGLLARASPARRRRPPSSWRAACGSSCGGAEARGLRAHSAAPGHASPPRSSRSTAGRSPPCRNSSPRATR